MAINKLHAMRLFTEVARKRSFSRAAHGLRLGVASVSEHVAALEREVGARLLDRTTRSLALTPEGAAYHALCERVLAEIDAVEDSLAAPPSRVAGRVRIDTPASLLRRRLIPALPEFHRAFPDVEIEFIGAGSMFQPSRGLADITLRSALPFRKAPPAGAIPLGDTRTVCAASSAYLAAHPAPARPSDLHAHRCLGFVDPESGRTWEWIFERDGQVEKLNPPCWMRMSNGELLGDAALAGLGIYMDLEINIAPHLAGGDLVELLPAWSRPQAIGYAFFDRAHALSRAATAYLDHLRGVFAAARR